VVLSFLLACLLDSPRRVPFLGFELIMPVAFGRDQFSPWRKFHVCMYVCIYLPKRAFRLSNGDILRSDAEMVGEQRGMAAR
jgi:hypothetical protein